MAISDSEKLDFIWKRFFGVGKTASAAVKFASNETIASAPPILPSAIWAKGDTIPLTPAATAGLVSAYVGSGRLKLTSDPTAPPNVAWLATSTYGDPTSRLVDFIAPSFGAGYATKVYIGDPNTGPAARIFPDTTGEEFVFDYSDGVLFFPNAIPANKPASVGTGTVSTAVQGIFIEVYQYIGAKGAGGGSTTGLGSMAYQDASAVAITGGTITNVTLQNVTVDGGEFS